MNDPHRSILVVGTGEPGMAVLRHLAKRTGPTSGITLSLLLRPATID